MSIPCEQRNDICTRNSKLLRRDGHLIVCHWDLVQKLLSNHLWVKRKIKFPRQSHLVPSTSHREREEFLVTRESLYLTIFFFEEKKQAPFSIKKKKERKRHQMKKFFLQKKSKVSNDENYLETCLNHHHLFLKLTPFVSQFFWTHSSWSPSQYHHLLPPILRAHKPLGITNLI